ncbi:MAG: NUDIX hydrolase [bacterium]|nr:NUDIX hydrolase [bacterium]
MVPSSMQGGCICRSVGAVIRNQQDRKKILVLHRKVQPVGLACPAGHTNPWEDAGDAIRRETNEETGIEIVDMHRYPDIAVPGVKCSRGQNFHWWSVFEVLSYRGEPCLEKPNEPEKHDWVRWMDAEEIRKYIDKCDRDLSWEIIWKILKII